MTKILLVVIAIIIAGAAVVILAPRAQNSDICVPIVPVDRSREIVNLFDGSTSQFASTTVDVMGRSTEGGTQTTFTKSRAKQIVEQRFYGETGRSYMRFYYNEDGAIFAITKLNLSYHVPIYVDSSATVKMSEKKDFYLNRDGTVCSWFLNDVEQSVDRDTQDMIREYIASIL